MKKGIVFILAFLYLTSSCDAAVYMHYCMGRPVGFSFTAQKTRSCHRCGMQKQAKGMGCCRDEQKLIKAEKNQKLPEFSYSGQFSKKFSITTRTGNAFSCGITRTVYIHSSPSKGPPGKISQPLYIRNGVFLI